MIPGRRGYELVQDNREPQRRGTQPTEGLSETRHKYNDIHTYLMENKPDLI
jgi:hypothetical protein